MQRAMWPIVAPQRALDGFLIQFSTETSSTVLSFAAFACRYGKVTFSPTLDHLLWSEWLTVQCDSVSQPTAVHFVASGFGAP